MLPLRYRRAWIGSVVLLVVLIVAGSLMPVGITGPVKYFDKFEHFVSYFALTLLGLALVAKAEAPRVIIRAILLGLAMEAAQALFTEARVADWADVLANTAGVMTAWWLAGKRAGWALAVEAWLAARQRH